MVDQKIKQTLKVAAGMGKGDDRYVGHLAHGEIILSNAFQKKYPGLIDDLRKAFERVGINMNRYIVGHKENRINSETGMPMYAEGMDGGGEGPGGGGGYGDGDGSAGGNGTSEGGGSGGGSGDGHGDGGDGSTPDTPVVEEPPPPLPEKKPVIPLTPVNTGVKLGYDPIPNAPFTPAQPTTGAPPSDRGVFYNARFTPATPPPMNTAAAPTMPSSMPDTPQTNPFASGSTMFEPGQQPAFADGGIVDAALKKVSSKYSDTGLPLNAMQILSKIAKSG